MKYFTDKQDPLKIIYTQFVFRLKLFDFNKIYFKTTYIIRAQIIKPRRKHHGL